MVNLLSKLTFRIMIRKITKKTLFSLTIVLSSFLALLLNISKDRSLSAGDLFLNNFDMRIDSVELAFASGAGGCSAGSSGADPGSPDGTSGYYAPTDSGVGIIYKKP